MHLLPLWFHHITLIGLFVVEIPLPFLAFVSGWPRLLTAAGTVGLMIGIMVAGYVRRLSVGIIIGIMVRRWKAGPAPRYSPPPFPAAAGHEPLH